MRIAIITASACLDGSHRKEQTTIFSSNPNNYLAVPPIDFPNLSVAEDLVTYNIPYAEQFDLALELSFPDGKLSDQRKAVRTPFCTL